MQKSCLQCEYVFTKMSNEPMSYWKTKRFCSSKCYGAYGYSVEHKQKLREAKLGRKQTKEQIEKRVSKMREENNPNWKGGKVTLICKECGLFFNVGQVRKDVAQFCSRLCKTNNSNQGKTPANEKIRKGAAYKSWRTLVFERDNYSCVECGVRGGSLHADHIKPFALFPELRLEISNGRTLCVPCHKKTGTYGRKSMYRVNNLLSSLNNF